MVRNDPAFLYILKTQSISLSNASSNLLHCSWTKGAFKRWFWILWITISLYLNFCRAPIFIYFSLDPWSRPLVLKSLSITDGLKTDFKFQHHFSTRPKILNILCCMPKAAATPKPHRPGPWTVHLHATWTHSGSSRSPATLSHFPTVPIAHWNKHTPLKYRTNSESFVPENNYKLKYSLSDKQLWAVGDRGPETHSTLL